MVDNNTYEFNANNPDLVNPNIVTNNELKQLAKNYKKMENKKRFNSQSLLLKPTVPVISKFAQNYNDNYNNTNNKPLLPPGWRWSPNSSKAIPPPFRSRTVSNVGDPLPPSSDQRSRVPSVTEDPIAMAYKTLPPKPRSASTASLNTRSRTSSTASTGSNASKRKLSYPPQPSRVSGGKRKTKYNRTKRLRRRS